MTIVLVAVGSSLMAISMFLLDRATRMSDISWGYMYGMIIAMVVSFCAWGWALKREWKRERILDQERKAREQREIERFEQEKATWEKTSRN